MGRPTKPEDEKAYNALLRQHRVGRTNAPCTCELCNQQLPLAKDYVLVIGAQLNIGRVGITCHTLDEIDEAVHALVVKALERR